jgi:hypothetical protein
MACPVRSPLKLSGFIFNSTGSRVLILPVGLNEAEASGELPGI